MGNPPYSIIDEEFEIVEERSLKDRIEVVLGNPKKRDAERALAKVYENLMKAGFYSMLSAESRGLVLYMFRREQKREKLAILAILTLITFVTVTISSFSFKEIGSFKGGFSWSVLAYPIGLLTPLLIHEVGHSLAMRIKKVPASPPYLLPAPPLQLGFLGTFGAVINMRWLPATLKDLAFIALAGPVSGFLVALPIAYLGISQSAVVGAEEITKGAEIPVVPFIFLVLLSMKLEVPKGFVVVLSPLAFAAMIAFYVTFLNLVPVGMLDGGHVVRALLGERLHRYTGLFVITLAALATPLVPTISMYLLVLIFIYTLSRGRHPGSSYNLEIRSHIVRVAIALIYALLLILTFPVPIL